MVQFTNLVCSIFMPILQVKKVRLSTDNKQSTQLVNKAMVWYSSSLSYQILESFYWPFRTVHKTFSRKIFTQHGFKNILCLIR